MVREPALRAAAPATLVLEQTSNLSVSVIVAQVRSTAVDLIRGWGLARDEAERLVRETAPCLATGEHAVPAHSSPGGSYSPAAPSADSRSA